MPYLCLVTFVQDKNKYNSPKYRLVVRFTNKYVLAQIIYATIQGDVVSYILVLFIFDCRYFDSNVILSSDIGLE